VPIDPGDSFVAIIQGRARGSPQPRCRRWCTSTRTSCPPHSRARTAAKRVTAIAFAEAEAQPVHALFNQHH